MREEVRNTYTKLWLARCKDKDKDKNAGNFFSFVLKQWSLEAWYDIRSWNDLEGLLDDLPPSVIQDAVRMRGGDPGDNDDDDGYNWIPLHYAVEKGPRSLVERVLTVVPGVIRVKDSDGWLLLHFAAHCKNSSVVELLIHLYPEALFEKNNCGKTPLDYINLDEVLKLPLVELSYQALGKNMNLG